MQPRGKEQANFPGRPTCFLAAPQSSTPFRSPGPVGGIEASGPSRATTLCIFRSHDWLAASGSPQNTSPFLSSGPAIGTQPSSYRAPPPFMRSNGPSSPPTSSFSAQDASTYQQSQALGFPPAPMHPPPPIGQPHASKWNFSSSVPNSVVPMGPPPQSSSQLQSRSNMPPSSGSVFSAPRTPPQPLLQGTSYRGGVQGLVEEFQSLTVGSVPGALDPEVDTKSLPRPLNGDEEPTKILEVYPFNCHLRFMRLTTHAIPNSQSLLSRWHLPLGAVVHPLAEAPDGEEVPIVNFGPAGIIRCRRCRTYVNPYVTFTDAGRKWRCNLCSLLNDVILILQFPVYTSICFTLILHEMITGLSRK
ncbi:protein transport protein Sec24-like [Musa troglodytarum]|uniref:Protein transport protein Sec24-like n=1 Tax=Musa troglodytarum TaxID=320322 RepID=A0A9E7KZW6_9LILI|nr:protein transport protein Sec24-like [Musa troglodytarum]